MTNCVPLYRITVCLILQIMHLNIPFMKCAHSTKCLTDNTSWLAPSLVLLPQARPTFAKEEGSGELHIQVVSCHTVWCGLITLRYLVTWHQHLSSNNGTELGQLFCYYRRCKNTLTILDGERVHFATRCLFEIWLRYLANCIPVVHGLYAVHQTLPSCGSGSGLWD